MMLYSRTSSFMYLSSFTLVFYNVWVEQQREFSLLIRFKSSSFYQNYSLLSASCGKCVEEAKVFHQVTKEEIAD